MRIFVILAIAVALVGKVAAEHQLNLSLEQIGHLLDSTEKKSFQPMRAVDEEGRQVEEPHFQFILEDEPGTFYDFFLSVPIDSAKIGPAIRCVVGKDHTLMTPDGERRITVPIPGLPAGMAMGCFLVSPDQSRAYYTNAIPHRLEVEAHGYRVGLFTPHPLGFAFSIYIEGLEPRETVKLEAISGGRTTSMELAANEEGTAVTVYSPNGWERDGGRFRVVASARRGTLEIASPWGREYVETYGPAAKKELEAFKQLEQENTERAPC